MNQIEYIEKVQSLKEQIVYMYSINCPKLAEVLKEDLAKLPEPEQKISCDMCNTQLREKHKVKAAKRTVWIYYGPNTVRTGHGL
jgi:hypothetical protein